MRALVLGGNGFIGSHLVEELLSRGDKIRVFDQSWNPCWTDINGLEYRSGRFCDTPQLSEALMGIDVVYHLISTSVPSTSNLDPVGDIQGNLVGTVNLLQQMAKLGVKRIVYLSSGGTVYGNPEQVPVPETHRLQPICSYGVVKVAIENYLSMFQHLHGIEPIVIRPSNPYGPRQRHTGVQGVIPTFLRRVLDGESIEVWGDGSIVRDYIYVSDLAELIAHAGSSEVTGVFNAGSGKGHSINDLLTVVGDVAEKRPVVRYKSGRSFDVQRVVLDISKAQEIFQWTPRVTLSDGISRHWEWLRDDLQ